MTDAQRLEEIRGRHGIHAKYHDTARCNQCFLLSQLDEANQTIADLRESRQAIYDRAIQHENTIAEKDAENRRLREALELAETAIRNGDHPELVLVHIQQALEDIDAGRYATPQQSLEDSLKQMKKIRNGELPKTTWHEFKRELDAEDGDSD
ncbi:hypothetical protein [Alicyclobacillus acidoterrestris]|uniref:Uncharacterized protein n=1 Tax=Alicyclobacillus acidoterrestris (strain ATCC 49025 / DSM 3922 / CIP 106132 / NCIMB 13137 / GD3B) TaxID=1356854 RepID=T0DDK4_ALIAG|nr:hypothetical protein [Alicyclobacillus acidoterrestris]EPZ47741.1 hypothetical protein N007_05660 [Alicyclobacillus acidoterrestris ATCC 49025]UNO47952.1 hypothetical protein K1I37_14855 [Alicyclobacillus acidoterrestris]